jgi:hypothetical protein
MPLFMVKEEVFQWIKTGQKIVEIRKGKAKRGNKQFSNVEGKFLEAK